MPQKPLGRAWQGHQGLTREATTFSPLRLEATVDPKGHIMRIRIPGRVALAAGALALLGATTAPGVAMAASEGSSSAAASPKPTIVLVHGAWADSSSWSSVMERLRKDGYPVRAIANPLQGLTSDT
ncbi:hypothetical protein, partial [Nonomuraea aridisoli]|uniref:hypothetical protein n=1 Tax=Nonomuraea aridisoli TaxID=2070368 RepID=UPI003F697892